LAENTAFAKILDKSIKEDSDVLNALESFISVYKEQRQKNKSLSMPLSLFSDRKLGSLEIVVKYLKENLSLNFSQIAAIINRDQRTIWCTYSKAVKKDKSLFKVGKEKYNVPFEIFSNRNVGPLEALVCYLKDNLKLSFKQISELLNRDYNTIWLSYKNGKNHDE